MEDIKSSIKNISSVPIGITRATIKPMLYNFKKNFVTIITAKKTSDSVDYCFNVLEAVKKLKNVNLYIINAEKTLQSETNNFVNDYNELSVKISINNNDKEHNVCVILGIDKFLNSIDDTQFKNDLEEAEKKGNYNFIIVDNATKIKDHTYEEWYKEYIPDDNGIWVGNGFDSQYLITINADRRDIDDNCGRDFGYLVKDGNYTMVKLLGMKKAGDDDE